MGEPGKAEDSGTPEQLTWYASEILKLSGCPPKNLLLLNMLPKVHGQVACEKGWPVTTIIRALLNVKPFVLASITDACQGVHACSTQR